MSRNGYHVRATRSGATAIASQYNANVVLLALDLPDLDGVAVCRRIRESSLVPMIGMLRGSSELQRVLALRMGLDMVLECPVGTTELLARINVMARRSRARMRVSRKLVAGPLEIDERSRAVRMNGRDVQLTRKEFDLLRLLATCPGTTFDRREILARVWHDDNAWMRRSRTIDTHVNSIRRKLGASSVIRTERGIGFQFDPSCVSAGQRS